MNFDDFLIDIVPLYLGACLIIFFMIIAIMDTPYGEIHTRFTKCYDKFGNEIRGTICKECYQYNLFGDKIILEKCEK